MRRIPRWAACALALLLAGCETPVVEPPPVAEPEVVEVPDVVVVRRAPDPASVAGSPEALVPAAVALQVKANRYVAWQGSKPGNIDTLTPLRNAVAAKTAAMQASEHRGHYDPDRVAAVRGAIADLRDFLANKKD